ncbi:His-Xaa-Ser system radical SAM maturase HxsC [Acidiphilium cryptum]|uniref:His-Xaa-Ser system radical SAM maturase HxsC n=1 Tax=Acidiphilium cryptum TaxID=524 RepID=UPI001E47D6CD|nr:His-Xaa-Ser system radical SAM maturase HxsC [Acidiphilium cryptum]
MRVQDPASCAQGPADAALIRSVDDAENAKRSGFKSAVGIGLSTDKATGFDQLILLDGRFDYLSDGDILRVHPNTNHIRTLYRRASQHNAFLVTERCNHWCLMCSQPPRNVSDGWIIDEIAECFPLLNPQPRSLGFTGGEPMTDWERFINLLSLAKDQLPSVALHVLTNGRAFAKPPIAVAWAALRHPSLTAGIPIYAAAGHLHDYIVQSMGAFDETVMGILRLKDQGQRVEVRVVLHALSVPRLVETAIWLGRNLPFVDHVALMGLEQTGFAIANQDQLWIEPTEYAAQLAEAVLILQSAGIRVSVYNLPLCLLPRPVWPASVQSISDWKNGFLPECEECAKRGDCPGFFSSGRKAVGRKVRPIKL